MGVIEKRILQIEEKIQRRNDKKNPPQGYIFEADATDEQMAEFLGLTLIEFKRWNIFRDPNEIAVISPGNTIDDLILLDEDNII